MAAIYCADIYCDDCAERIKRTITSGIVDCDSNQYPQYCDNNQESDTPEHCADCGVFFENDLTTDGADYVKETVREDIEFGHTDTIALTVWMPYYDWIDFDFKDEPVDGDFTITPCGSLGCMSGLGRIEGNFVGEFNCDDDAVDAAKQIMQDEQFWPNIWMVSDHGNWSLYTEREN